MLIICGIIISGCLIAASVSDIRTHFVADLVWMITASDVLLLMLSHPLYLTEVALIEALVVILVQENVMSRCYGRADSHAFSCCFLFMAASGCRLESHIIHMTLSLIMLTVIQIIKGNIGKGLRLKKPVPFIPYISASFFPFVFIHCFGMKILR